MGFELAGAEEDGDAFGAELFNTPEQRCTAGEGAVDEGQDDHGDAEAGRFGEDVLLRVYAKCLDGHQKIANKRIEDALAA
ncbi:hypothetical protein ACFWY5_02625 [Nonomuraea sp. NPDC059007]|uniref:hypothetical protein n=1 Tax=Nonomuraea sp. NPDC059007 TaxID=3346692 RepID=UPI00367503FD